MKQFILESLRFYLNESTNNLTLYHGSQKEINSKEGFLTKYIKTGEGNNMFGWGLYFTDNRDIAASYSKNNTANINNRFISLANDDFNMYDIDKIIKHYKSSLEDMRMFDPEQYNQLVKFISFLNQAKKEGFTNTKDLINKGFLYTVNLNPSKKFAFDWNGKAPEFLLKKLNIKDNLTGKDLYKKLTQELGSDELASKFLYDNDFYGIKYPTNTLSSNEFKSGEGNNYVIFNDRDISIVKVEKL